MSAFVFQGKEGEHVFIMASQNKGYFPKRIKSFFLKEGILKFLIENGRKILLHTK